MLAVTLTLLLGSIGHPAQQVSVETEVLAASRSFGAKLGITVPDAGGRVKILTFPGMAQRTCTVHFNRFEFTITHPDNQVTLFVNVLLEADLRKRTGAESNRFGSANAWWSHAEALMLRVYPSLNYAKERFTAYLNNDPNPERKGRVLCVFEDQPYGISTKGKGNQVMIEFDRRTGEVVRLSRSYGVTIPEPRIAIAEAAARAKAIDAMRVHLPALDRTIGRVVQGYMLPNKFLGSVRGADLSRRRQLIYGFAVAFPRATVFIDGVRGDVVGGALHKSP